MAALVLVAVVVSLPLLPFSAARAAQNPALRERTVVASDTQVTIPEGAPATDVSNALASAGVSVSADAFLIVRNLGADQKFQAGTAVFCRHDGRPGRTGHCIG
ncbi:MAG: hypothetical protein ACLTQI_05400 [Slackia sp.]